MGDYHPEGVSDFDAYERVEEEFREHLRESAQEARDRLGDLGDLPEPLRWKIEVCAAGCQVHDDPRDCEGPVEGAHLIPQSALKARGMHAHLWDRRNGLSVCRRVHTESDSGKLRFPVEKIPPEAWEFAAWLNLTYLLERLYGKRPEELAA